VTWLAVGLAVGLACGGTLMTWWSSKRIEREGKRQYEMGIAEGVRLAERERQDKGAPRAGGAKGRQRRRRALRNADLADDVVA
jgi:hypothetical protein